MKAARERLRAPGRVALWGPPGAGKSTLAAALASDAAARAPFGAGVLWAGLGPKADVAGALNRWGTRLGVDLGVADDVRLKAQRLSTVLQERGQGRPWLLVLDDVWALEDVRAFQDVAFPGCGLLVTTREAAIARAIAGEELPVGALSDEEVDAFVAERCKAAKEADPEGLKELLQAIGGLPLVLSLLAGALAAKAGQAQWVREEISRLAKANACLDLEAPESRPGHGGSVRTLREIVELSVNVLDEDAQRMFAALGAFAAMPADFGRKAALAVSEMKEGRGDEVLRRLCDAGLAAIAGEGRFALHQVVAAVAAERLGAEEGPRARHAQFYQGVVDADGKDWQRIEEEIAQIRQAFGWLGGSLERGADMLPLVHGLETFFALRGLKKEHLGWAEQALEVARARGRQLDEAVLLNTLGVLHFTHGDKAQALSFCEQALGILRRVEANFLEAGALAQFTAGVLNNIGGMHQVLGDTTQAVSSCEQALTLQRQAGDRAGEAVSLHNIGKLHQDRGDKALALSYYEQSLALKRQVGNRAGEAMTLHNIGRIHHDRGDKAKALSCYAQALALACQVGDRAGEAATLYGMARVLEARGRTAEAIRLVERVVAIREAIDHPNLASDRATLKRLRGKAQVVAWIASATWILLKLGLLIAALWFLLR
jgi:tetratricopeptide (TPR) repeat protein